MGKRQRAQRLLDSAVQSFQSGQLEDAAIHCEAVLKEIKGEANALQVLGVIRLRQNDPEAAAKLLTQAHRHDPGNADTLVNLGAAHRSAGEAGKAVEVLQKAVAMAPQNPSAHLNLANAQFDAGAHAQARESYLHVLSMTPGHLGAQENLARLLRDMGNADEALAAFEELDRLAPDNPETLNEIGALQAATGELEDAEHSLRKAVEIAPDNHKIVSNLANVLAKTFRDTEAQALYRTALEQTPNDPALLCNVGNAVAHAGQHRQAADYYRQALAIDPDNVDAHAGLANNLLAGGHFAEGWKHFLERNSVRALAGRLNRTPFAKDLTGSRIVVFADQGLGDQIFFARYLAELRGRGAHVTLRPDARLVDMLIRADIADEVSADATPGDDGVFYASGDLPYLLGAADNTALPTPFDIPVLSAREAALRQRLKECGPGPWIGVTWRAGTPNARQALMKEAPAALFAEALRDVDGSVVVIQRNAHEGEIDRFAAALGRPVIDLSDANDDIEDLLALSGLLDRYVAVSSTMTHLRAACGGACDVFVPCPAEFRWMSDGGNSPWFPGSRIYRQPVDGKWATAFHRFAETLRR